MTIGKMLTGLSLIVASCAAPRPVVYARPDYGVGWDKEVALYNIQQILKNCATPGESYAYADENRIHKHTKFCTKYGRVSYDEVVLVDLTWDEVAQKPIQVVEDGQCLYFSVNEYERESCMKDRLCANNAEQTTQLKQAIEIYLQERRKQ